MRRRVNPRFTPGLTAALLALILATAACTADNSVSAPLPVAAPPALMPASSPTKETTNAGSRYVFPIQGCAVYYDRSHREYPATDLFAARGCRVVSPIAGRVDEVSKVDRWRKSTDKGVDRGGLSFSVVGDDGVRYYGSHLSSVVVQPGQRVLAGQTVGRVGRSGSARGTSAHLHFGLSWPTRAGVWWVRRGEVAPWPYLDSWRGGGVRSPVAAVSRARAARGDVPPCPSHC